MNLLMLMALAANLAAGPALTGPQMDRALRNYQAVLQGREQLVDLPLPERSEVIELDRWLRSREGIVPSETQRECKARIASGTPSQLEEALLDLKCSQRPRP
jgi:hypothetical protein